MADHNNPQVKHSGGKSLMHLVPGANSWAQEQLQKLSRKPATNTPTPAQLSKGDKYEEKPVPAQPSKGDKYEDKPTPTQPPKRDRYADKPMPPLPLHEDDPPSGAYSLKSKTCIQPAIPKLPSFPIVPKGKPSVPPVPEKNPLRSILAKEKNRAATDPIIPKPLFYDAKAKLRRQFSLSKGKAESSKEISSNASEGTPVPHIHSGQAPEILGVNQKPASTINTPPASASFTPTPHNPIPSHQRPRAATPLQRVQPPRAPTRGTPVPLRETPALAQSTPVPTKRYLFENPHLVLTETSNMHQNITDPVQQDETHQRETVTNRYLLENPHLALTETSNTRQNITDPVVQDESQQRNTVQGVQFSTDSLHPIRIGMRTNVGEVGLVEGAGMPRVESLRGVIENAPPSAGSNHSADPYENTSQPSTEQAQGMNGPVQSASYSPSDYGGVWENNPAVGRTLPPITPMRSDPSSARGTTNQDESPFAHQYPAASANHGQRSYPMNGSSTFQRPAPSGNSWASNDSSANFSAPSRAQSPGVLPPRGPHQQYANSVPSPPANVHDFQRVGSVTAALAHMDLSVHHHIDSSHGSLSGQITEKCDRTTDRVLTRIDKFELGLKKGFRDIRNLFRDLKTTASDTHAVADSIQGEARQHYDGIMNAIASIETKVQAVEKKCVECINTIEQERERQHRSETTSPTPRRRTESAHPTFGQGESRGQNQGETSRLMNRAEASGTSSQRDQSNASSAQQSVGGMSRQGSHRRQFFAEMGANMGSQPDLRDHPAYANNNQNEGQQAHGQGEGHGREEEGDPVILRQLPFHAPSLTNGRWYEQAYGRQ